MVYNKIKPDKYKKKSSFVAEQILEFIRAGVHKPGTKLQPERTIAEKMGVGRPVVREAISALQIVGVLEARIGDGTYVSEDFSADDSSQNVKLLLESSDSPFEILQIRKAIEIGTVFIAVSKATDDEISEIRLAWERMKEKGKRGQYSDFIKFCRPFHSGIANATGYNAITNIMNDLLEMTVQPLWLHMRQTYYQRDPNRIKPIIEHHEEILSAMEKRDAYKAAKMMSSLFDVILKQQYEIKTEDESS